MKTLPSVLLVAAVLACTASNADEGPPPLVVTVGPQAQNAGPSALPVEFLAPFPAEELERPETPYLVGPSGQRFICEVTPLEKPAVDLGYRWARVSTLVPATGEVHTLTWVPGALPASVAVVSSIVAEDEVVLDTGRVRLISKADGRGVFDSLTLAGRTIVPEYIAGLVNRQQSMELVVTDRIRHVDFSLRPAGRLSFAAEKIGPVVTTVVYKGSFSGSGQVDAVEFESRISLFSSGLVRLDVTLRRGALDPERFALKTLRIAVPLVLHRASSLSFGGASNAGGGRRYWKGSATLSVSADGSYLFTDGDSSRVSGRGVTWADYGDGEAGLGIVWPGGQPPLELSVDFNEDFVEMALTPTRGEDGKHTALVYLFAHPFGTAGDILSSTAASLENSHAVDLNADYVKAITGVK